MSLSAGTQGVERSGNVLGGTKEVAHQGEVKGWVQASQRWYGKVTSFFMSKCNWSGICVDKREWQIHPEPGFGRASGWKDKDRDKAAGAWQDTVASMAVRQWWEGSRVLTTKRCGGWGKCGL